MIDEQHRRDVLITVERSEKRRLAYLADPGRLAADLERVRLREENPRPRRWYSPGIQAGKTEAARRRARRS